MKVKFTREFIIKDLSEKFKYENLRPQKSVVYVPKSIIHDLNTICYTYPAEIKVEIDRFYPHTIVIIANPALHFELGFFGWNYYNNIFKEVPTYGGIFNDIFYESIFNISAMPMSDFKLNLQENIKYLIKNKYIYVDFIGGREELILGVDKDGKLELPNFNDIEVGIRDNLLRDSEITRKIKLKSLSGEEITI